MANKKTTKKTTEAIVPAELKPLSIEWHIPEGLVSPYASYMVAQSTENIVKILFFQTNPPLHLDKSEPPPTKARADCVASVVITPDKIPRIIEVLQKHYDKHMERLKK